MAVGSKFASPSAALGTLRAAINNQGSKPIEITPDQWKFLRGVYAMNPEAPCGLPYGDNAVLAQDGGDSDGLLFFMDGDRLCPPMQAPPTLLPAFGAGHDGRSREWALNTQDFIVRAAASLRGRFGIAFGAERLALVPFRTPAATVLIALVLAVLAVLGIDRIRIDDSLSQLFHSESPAFKLAALSVVLPPRDDLTHRSAA
jgi:hypothetical protein